MDHKKTQPSIRPRPPTPPGISEIGLGTPQSPLDSSVHLSPAAADRSETAPSPQVAPSRAAEIVVEALQGCGFASAADVQALSGEIQQLGHTLRGMRDRVQEHLETTIRRLTVERDHLRVQVAKLKKELDALRRPPSDT